MKVLNWESWLLAQFSLMPHAGLQGHLTQGTLCFPLPCNSQKPHLTLDQKSLRAGIISMLVQHWAQWHTARFRQWWNIIINDGKKKKKSARCPTAPPKSINNWRKSPGLLVKALFSSTVYSSRPTTTCQLRSLPSPNLPMGSCAHHATKTSWSFPGEILFFPSQSKNLVSIPSALESFQTPKGKELELTEPHLQTSKCKEQEGHYPVVDGKGRDLFLSSRSGNPLSWSLLALIPLPLGARFASLFIFLYKSQKITVLTERIFIKSSNSQ